jgi:alpha-glucosidase
VSLRYKLLPLYQLWNDQEQSGTAVMRPLFYDFANTDGMELDRVDDQFLVGPAILQAPIVHQGQQTRLVTLPGQGRWMDVNTGHFLTAGRTIHVTSSVDATPIYLREGSLLPLQVGERTSAANDLADIELHVVLGRGSDAVATLDYVADDGLSYGYQRGERSVVRFSARR